MREFSIFRLSKPEWESSKIGVKSNGGWAVFTDPITHKSLNSPRNPYPEPKITYKRKTEEQIEHEEQIRNWRELKTKKKGNNFNNFSTVANPLLNPPKDNYKEFRARKHLIGSKNSNNDFDDSVIISSETISSRSIQHKPKKTAQLAKDIQITSLNTQRYFAYSHSSLARCTPRSQDTLQHYDNELCDDIQEVEEEIAEEISFTISTNSLNNSNTNKNEIEMDEYKNEETHESKANDENETSVDDTHIVQDENNKEENKINNNHYTNAQNEIHDNNTSFNETENAIENEAESNDIHKIQSDVEIENKFTLSDDIDFIEIKVESTNVDEIDGTYLKDSLPENEVQTKDDFNKSNENEDNNNQIKSVTEEGQQTSFDQNDANKIATKIDNKISNIKTSNQWKNKRTGKIISRKCTNNNTNSSFDIPKNDNSNLDLIKSKSQKIIARSSYEKDNSLTNQNDFNHSQPNDQVIHYKFKYNNNRTLNLRRANSKSNFKLTKKKFSNDITDKTQNKQNTNNNNQVTKQNHLNDINSNNNGNLNEIAQSEDQKQTSNSNKISDVTSNNTKNDTIIIFTEISNTTNNIENNEVEIANKNDTVSKEVVIKNNIEAEDIDQDHNNIKVRNVDIENDSETENVSNNMNNAKPENLNNYNKSEINSNHSDISKDENEIDIIVDICDDTDNIKAENNSQTSFSAIDDIKDDTTTDNQNDLSEKSIDDNSNDDSNLPQFDDYDNDNISNTSSVKKRSTLRNTKKVSNVYGHNYNDYNYYGNVIKTNSKLYAPGNSSFEFIGSSTNGISNLSTEISHNISPLPSTRRPATSTRQRYIERPECIGPQRFFKGDDPAPARRFFQSANLVAEMRHEEELKMIANAKVKINLSKTISRKGPSLFERSIKPREKLYCWPRDFAHFSAE